MRTCESCVQSGCLQSISMGSERGREGERKEGDWGETDLELDLVVGCVLPLLDLVVDCEPRASRQMARPDW